MLFVNDALSLRANITAFSTHLNPRGKIDLTDLIYTRSERRSRLFHRGFVTTRKTDIHEDDIVIAKKIPQVILMLTLAQVPGSKEWHVSCISTTEEDVVAEHCFGLLLNARPQYSRSQYSRSQCPLRPTQLRMYIIQIVTK
jgi:hypothetical protein